MSLKRKLFLLYLLAGLVGVMFIEFQNYFVNGRSWIYILKFNLPIVLLQNIFFVFVYYFYSVYRLKDVIKLEQNDKNYSTLSAKDRTILFQKLVHFPFEMFRFSVFFMIFMGVLFRVYSAFLADKITHKFFLNSLLSFLIEQSLGMIITLTIIAFLVKTLRPSIIKLNQPSIKFIQISLTKKIFLVFFSLLFIIITDLIRILLIVQGPIEIIIYKTCIVLTVLLLFSIVSIRLIIMDSIKYTHQVAEYITAATKNEREDLHKLIPVTTNDEIGYLVGSFNELQIKIQNLYKEIDDELKLALNIQKKLLPQTTFEYDNFIITGLSLSVKETGGDFFDIIKINDRKLGLLIGDVSGNGLPAALFMSMMMGVVRGKIHEGPTSPAKLLEEINMLLKPMLNDGMYVSAGLGVVDLDTNILIYSSAGHVSPFIKTGEKIFMIDQSSLPLGIDEDEIYSEVKLSLQTIDGILLYTDGILEQRNQEKKMYGFERLCKSFEKNWNKDGETIISGVYEFSKGMDREDDMTVVHIKRSM